MSIKAAFMVPHPPMIIPEVGGGSEAQIEKTIKAYDKVAEEIAELEPDTIIISSPHSVMYADYFHISPGTSASGSFSNFRAPTVKFFEKYDSELVEAICGLAERSGVRAGVLGEKDSKLDHGTMVPLYFIRKKYKDFKLVRIGLSGLSFEEHYKLGQIIAQAVDSLGRSAVYVASGDLSHKLQDYGPYGYVPEGPEYDDRLMKACAAGDFGELLEFDEGFCDKAAECGHRSFIIMAGALDGYSVKAELLSHEDVTGVGYGVCTFYPEGEDAGRHFWDSYIEKKEQRLEQQREQADEYVRLARKSLESYIRNGKRIDIPEDIPAELKENRAGVFVSIHEHGKLRGCIGTILPITDCIASEIIDNAISASTKDYRFDPIREDELKWLEINVDVLTTPEPIESADMLDVKRYGVIVSSGYKRGLLLPDLDGVDSVEQQISIAMQKGGISPGDEIKLERFEVIRHV